MTAKVERRKQDASREEFTAMVERAVQGDSEALDELCGKTFNNIVYQVSGLLGGGLGQDSVEDLAQEVLILVCRDIKNLRNPKSFGWWLKQIIMNVKNRYLGKHMERKFQLNIDDYAEALTEQDSGLLPSNHAENLDMKNTVMDTISTLPSRQMEAVILHYVVGLSVSEVAGLMETTTQTVSKNLSIARNKLKSKLEDQW